MAGEVEITVDGMPERARAGDIAVITPFRIHSFKTPEYCKIWIGVISSDFAEDFLSGDSIYNSGDTAVFTPTKSLFDYLCEHLPPKYDNPTVLEGDAVTYRKVKALVYSVFEEYTRTVPQTKKSVRGDALSSTLLYMSEHFAEFNNANEIARVNSLIDSIIGEYTATPVSSGVTNVASPVKSVTLNLDAKPTIRFYVSDTTVEFFANDKKLNTKAGTDETYGTYVELDVYAYVLCQTIYYGDGGSYHISSFVTGSVGTSHEALVKAFVKYTESAADYRSSVIGSNK